MNEGGREYLHAIILNYYLPVAMTMMLKSQLNKSKCTMHLTSVTTVGVFLKQVLKIAHPLPEWTLQCISVGIITPCTHVQVGDK